jgi:hypothetical protein
MSKQYPPIWKDGVLMCDKNHTQAKIGRNGHGGSSAGIQYHISVDPNTGELLCTSQGGVANAMLKGLSPSKVHEGGTWLLWHCLPNC